MAGPPGVLTPVRGAWPMVVEMPPATFCTRDTTGPAAWLTADSTVVGPTIAAAVIAEATTATAPVFKKDTIRLLATQRGQRGRAACGASHRPCHRDRRPVSACS